MKNITHLLASFYLFIETELDQDQFETKFNKETIINSKIEITLPDGSVHKVSFVDLVDWKVIDFENNKLEDKKKPPSNVQHEIQSA